jgi:hypothetical protein
MPIAQNTKKIILNTMVSDLPYKHARAAGITHRAGH